MDGGRDVCIVCFDCFVSGVTASCFAGALLGFECAVFALVAAASIALTSTVLGAMTIEIFVAPVAAVLVVCSVVLIRRHPEARHCLAGLLFAPAIAGAM